MTDPIKLETVAEMFQRYHDNVEARPYSEIVDYRAREAFYGGAQAMISAILIRACDPSVPEPRSDRYLQELAVELHTFIVKAMTMRRANQPRPINDVFKVPGA